MNFINIVDTLDVKGVFALLYEKEIQLMMITMLPWN
jgi:hypothetical protein